MVMQKERAAATTGSVQKQDASKKSDAGAALRGKSYDEQVQVMSPGAGDKVQMEGAPAAPAAGPTLRKGLLMGRRAPARAQCERRRVHE